MPHRPAMSQKPTTCALERFANEMNWCHAGRYLFARNSRGQTTSTRSRNSTACRRIDPADGLRTVVEHTASFRCGANGWTLLEVKRTCRERREGFEEKRPKPKNTHTK